MSVSRVRENRMHGSMRRREATPDSRASTRRAAEEASRRPYSPLRTPLLSHVNAQKHPWAQAPSPADEIAAMHRKAGQLATTRISNQRDLGLGVAQRFSWMSITRAKATGDRVGSDEPLTVDAVQRERTFADLAVPPITARPRTAAWHRQYARAERIMFGLPTSPQSIAVAAADPAATSDQLATPLTPAENAQLLAANRTGLNLEAVSQAAQAALPGSFAGAWYEYDNGGTIYVSFTSQACPSRTLLSQLAHIAGTRTVAVAAANNATVTRLSALDAAVNGDKTMLRSLGVIINRTESDTSRDRVLVTLDPSSHPNAKSLMTMRYGSQGLAFAAPAPRAQLADARTNPSANKVHGGQLITRRGLIKGRYEACTSNLSIRDQAGRYYVMTAGHCFTKGTETSQNGNDFKLAYSAAKSIGRALHTPSRDGVTIDCDCEAIGPISASRSSGSELGNNNRVFTLKYVAFSNKYFIHSPLACESGAFEYEKYGQRICGKVDDAHVSETGTDGSITFTIDDMIHVNYAHGATVQRGDSGAPVTSNGGLLGLVTDTSGDTSKAKNMPHIYGGSSWVIPRR